MLTQDKEWTRRQFPKKGSQSVWARLRHKFLKKGCQRYIKICMVRLLTHSSPAVLSHPFPNERSTSLISSMSFQRQSSAAVDQTLHTRAFVALLFCGRSPKINRITSWMVNTRCMDDSTLIWYPNQHSPKKSKLTVRSWTHQKNTGTVTELPWAWCSIQCPVQTRIRSSKNQFFKCWRDW